jgi:hypothetical protein
MPAPRFRSLASSGRIDRSDFERLGSNLLDSDVAGQHGSDLVLGQQCVVRQAWIARAKDAVRPEVRADLFLSVACWSISVRMPNPCSCSAALTRPCAASMSPALMVSAK